MPKLHQLRGDLLFGIVVDTQCTLIGIFREFEDEARLSIHLQDRCDAGPLKLVPKNPHHIRYS